MQATMELIMGFLGLAKETSALILGLDIPVCGNLLSVPNGKIEDEQGILDISLDCVPLYS